VRILVDTSVWRDYFYGVVTPRTDYLDGILGRAPVVTADLILSEVLQGFVDGDEMARAHAALTRFTMFNIGGRQPPPPARQGRAGGRRPGRPDRHLLHPLEHGSPP
jgi:hypothetical protein